MQKHILLLIIIFCGVGIIACKSKKVNKEQTTIEDVVQTPVTITNVTIEPLSNYVELNATSAYLQNNYIKSSVNGYIKSVHIQPGQFIRAGQLAFVMQTKESKALGNTINKLDPSFQFSGIVRIAAPAGGFIADLSHQAGDYVPDGEQLAVLTNSKSFGFILNLPFELRNVISINKNVEVELPDGVKLKGIIASMMPTVDSASQTQAVMIKVNSNAAIPQNVIAKVRILKGTRNSAPSLPKEAVLTDEAQSNFWVMKMIDSITAVKVPVVKGMETVGRIEIISPAFSASDRILLTGNYGLGDTAKVKIVKGEE
jgi:hypothetical protein